jgi:hypothetical protein
MEASYASAIVGVVIQVQADAAVIARLDPGRVRFIIRQPGNQSGMRVAVPPVSDRRGHVNLSFDQLGLLELGHRIVPPLELGAGQAVAVLQRKDHSVILGHIRSGRLGRLGRGGHEIGLRDAGFLEGSTERMPFVRLPGG